VSFLDQAPHHFGAHFPQSYHRKLHKSLLLTIADPSRFRSLGVQSGCDLGKIGFVHDVMPAEHGYNRTQRIYRRSAFYVTLRLRPDNLILIRHDSAGNRQFAF
jgi:hypothetical protein